MIVAGFGFRQGATPLSLCSALARAGLPEGAVVHRFATAADKACHPALVALATEHGVDVYGVHPDRLAACDTPTQSAAARAARDVGSLAEAAAFAAAGPGARLIRPRAISLDRRATCALAWKDPP